MVRSRRILFLAAAAMLSASPAVAQQAPPKEEVDRCLDNAHTQLDMTTCAVDDRVKADRDLNRAYQALLPTLDPERREILRTAQRQWISFRDAQCAYETSEYTGGSMAPMIESLCVARLTRARIRDLQPDEAR
jgi:uncharacterized protein YecT (DUF1311 family)